MIMIFQHTFFPRNEEIHKHISINNCDGRRRHIEWYFKLLDEEQIRRFIE